MRRLVAWITLSAALGAASGCATTEALRGLPPFLESDYAEGDDTTDVLLRPLFRYRDQPKRREGSGRDRTDFHYLFPFGHYKRRGDDVEHHLWPLFQWIRRTDEEGFVSRDYLFFPFVWGGHDPAEGSYFTLWPLGGTLKSLFGKDEIVHVLFPLFSYTRLHDYRTYNVLFPFFAWQAGEGNEGFRIFPFYGHQRKTRDGRLVFDRYSVLFPFFAWEKDNMNTKNPFTAWVVFPFYGETRSRLVDETTILWPFFRKRVEKKDEVTRWRVPFPFVMLSSGAETQYDFWPFAGWRRNGGFTRSFALWPVIRTERHVKADVVTARHWAVPFAWSFEEKDRRTGKTLGVRNKLWPLIRVERGRGDLYDVRFPSPLWFEDGPEENFESILTPLLEVVRYRRAPGKGSELRLLFSAFISRWGRDDDENGWSLLGGLVGHRTTREGEGRVRLLYFIEL